MLPYLVLQLEKLYLVVTFSIYFVESDALKRPWLGVIFVLQKVNYMYAHIYV